MRRQSLESGWTDEEATHDALRMRRWPLFSNAIWNPSSLNYRVVAGSVWMAHVGLLPVCRQFVLYPAKPPQKACFIGDLQD